MAPKRPAAAAAASGSASEASDAEADAGRHPSSPSPSKTPPPNPNPKSAAGAGAAPASVSAAAEDSAAAGSDSGAAYDSDADHRPAPPKPAVASPRPRSPKRRSRTPDANSDSDGSAAPAASDADADPAAGADSDDGNGSPLAPPPRPSRAEAAAIKPISSRPMDSPRRSMPSFSEPRPKRPRSAAVPSTVEQLKRPSRLWSPGDELVILRGLVSYRAKRGVLPGSMHDIGKLHGHIGGQLSVKVTTTQLSDKVRRLKQKYHLLAARAKNGRDPDLPTPHDHTVYELGKKVWGASVDAGGGSAAGGYENVGGGESEEDHESGESDGGMDSGRDDRGRKNRRMRPITMANGNGTGIVAFNANSRGRVEFEKVKDAFPYLWETVEDLSQQHPNGVAFKKAFELIEGPKARGMEEKLRKFRVTEIRHQLRRMELMKETVKMVLDALEG